MKSLKHILIGFTAALLMMIILAPHDGHAQVVNASTKKRISVGVGMFTDIWLNKPSDMRTRNINQGVSVFGTYNMPFGKSNFSFAIGLGVSVHNLYWNYYLPKNPSGTFQFAHIPDTISHKRSKITLPYLELPLEFRYKTKSKVAIAIGFKIGYMMYAHAKWVGKDYLLGTGSSKEIVSFKNIKNIEKYNYGPTLRIGYKWFHVNASYSLAPVFTKGTGVDMYPISVGFVLLPF
ncbi:MAG: outer membrane beta-barrel protein [Bacteroidota bacterium]